MELRLIGETLGHYKVTEKLGAGGMGEVYRARDLTLDRDVALKVLPQDLSSDPERLDRFEREAKAVAALNHPNIVTLFSVEKADGGPFLTMELVEGKPLDEAIPDAGLPMEQFAALASQLLEGVAAAHKQGIIHRDLKPSNIMLTEDGRLKVLDFGLAKLRDLDDDSISDSELATALLTEEGRILGTPAYMAPEQAEGKPVDGRADIFAIGAVLYEMLTGSRPFVGESRASVQAAILTADPSPPRKLRHEIPKDLDAIVLRCLAKDPPARFDTAEDLLSALQTETQAFTPASPGVPRTRSWTRALLWALPLVLLFGAAAWLWVRNSRLEEARQVTLPEIERLLDDSQYVEGFLMARQAQSLLPEDPVLRELMARASETIRLTSEPPGAEIFYRNYTDEASQWRSLGLAPIENATVPAAFVLSWRVEKEGYETLEVGRTPSHSTGLEFKLAAAGESPPGMAHVPAGQWRFRNEEPVDVPAFWLDKYEVTNRQFKEFVDAGGYENQHYWKHVFEDEDGDLSWEEAMAQFVDSTGRPGPATWSLGTYPEGEDDFPVAGVSWYEAVAYAEFSGKSLPTVYHWRMAAPWTPFGDMLLLSNFGGDGPVEVGSLRGIGHFGHYDLAGNVNEWCWNRATNGRYLLGGSWTEPSYTYANNFARSPLDRQPDLGFRCAKYPTPPTAELTDPVGAERHDFRKNDPVSAEVFAIYRGLFEYEPLDLEAQIESVDESGRHWSHETVSFNAAYGDERVLAHIFLPRDASPPYQTVVYVPGSSASSVNSIEAMRSDPAFFVPRSGRALVWPTYDGTLERGGGGERPSGSRAQRDLMIHKVNDLQRTIDYLETRNDIDSDQLVYMGLSAGSEYGPVYLAIEPRFEAAALIAGGFDDFHMLEEAAEINPWNYAPRVTTPILMVNGNSDYGLPVETAQKPMFDLLGVPPGSKRHVLLEGGHLPYDLNAVMREILDWYDLHQGPVRR
ncbi:MAG: protein kinase [Thermoanaerobaculia bacterium]